jgi:hypothetical protein
MNLEYMVHFRGKTGMESMNILSEKKTQVVKKWFAMTLNTYPSGSALFLADINDRFSNPVGWTIYNGLNELYELILSGSDFGETNPSLASIIKIKAVQNCSSAEDLEFVFLLKRAIREVLGKDINSCSPDIAVFDERIDHLALAAMKMYVKCKQQIFEIRLKEVKSQNVMMNRIMNGNNEDKVQGCMGGNK